MSRMSKQSARQVSMEIADPVEADRSPVPVEPSRDPRWRMAQRAVASMLVLGVLGTASCRSGAADGGSRAAGPARNAGAETARSDESMDLLTDLLESLGPDSEAAEQSLAIRDWIESARARLREGGVRDESTRAELFELLDSTSTRYGWYDLQVELRRDRLDEVKGLHGVEDPRTESAAVSLAYALLPEYKASEVRQVLVENVPDLMQVLESNEASARQLDLLDLMAAVERHYGYYDVALENHRRGLEIATELGDPNRIYSHQIMVSRMLWRLGRFGEALEASDAAEPMFSALRGSDQRSGRSESGDQAFSIEYGSRDVASWYSDSWLAYRADLMMDLGRSAEALELFLEAEEVRSQESPDDFTRHVWGAGAARALHGLGRTREALRKSRQAREGMVATQAPDWLLREAARQTLTMLAELGRSTEHDRELAAFRKAPSRPLALYQDGRGMPYSPSGIMGEVDKVRYHHWSTVSPFEGEHCFQWKVEPGDSWVALAWLEPANDWGEMPGGFDLSGAERLSFVARGSRGGERVVAGIGVVDQGEYADTVRERMPIELTGDWQRFTLELDGLDLSNVRCGFVIESELTDESQTIYFDDIRIE